MANVSSVTIPQQLDRNAPRDRFARVLVFFTSMLIVIGLPMTLCAYWTGFFWNTETLGAYIGFIGGSIVFINLSLTRMIIYNKEYSAYVTQDPFNGGMVIYGPGAHISYPWEQRNKNGNYSLKVLSARFKVSVPTTTARLEAAGEYLFCFNLRRLTQAIAIDDTMLSGDLTSFINKFLTDKLSAESADEALKKSRLAELNKDLNNPPSISGSIYEFAAGMGLISVKVVLESLKLPEDAQTTRDAIDEGAQMLRIIAGMLGISPEELARRRGSDGDISHADYDRLLDKAMAMSKNAEMKINNFTLGGGTNVGSAAAAAAAAFGAATAQGRPRQGGGGKRNQSSN